MDPARKRRVRLVVALSAAVVLTGALVYTSFGAATEETTPSKLQAGAQAGQSYDLTGKVVKGSVDRSGDTLRFRVRDRTGEAAVPVVYAGTVPDPFREEREVIVTGRMESGTFVGERDSLVTKCPSKFTKKPSGEQS